MTPRPLFLLSLPRSGSTLVQRVLASHDGIATAPEPWVLLPLLYAARERGWYAEFGHVTAVRAIREFAQRLPRGDKDYSEALRAFVGDLYDRASPEATTYFLDKTPRYHYIATDLFRLFPDAKVVFLWRNPLAVAASVVDTWAGGRWSIERWHGDLFDGVDHLLTAYESHREQSHAVRYEDLVVDPLTSWPQLLDFLEIRFDRAVLESFTSLSVAARMGDPTGTSRYHGLSTEPLEKWKATLTSHYRKRWATSYLRWIGEARLATMGYDLEELERQLEEVPTRLWRSVSDPLRGVYWWADRVGRRRAAQLLWRRLPGR